LAVSGLVLLFFMLAIWLPGQWWSHDEWWETGGAIGAFGLLAAMCLIGRGHHWRWLGVAASVVGCAMALVGIWLKPDSPEEAFTIVTSIALVAAHANLVVRAPLKPGQHWLGWATIGAGIVTAAFVDALVCVQAHDIDSTLGRLAGAAGVLTGCGSLALLVLARLNRAVDLEPGSIDMVEMTVICPRCRKKQTVPIGDGRCGACDLRINIRVEEPRCRQCGYLLYKLTSDACPECGTPIEGDAPAKAGG